MWNKRDTYAILAVLLMAFALFTERMLSADMGAMGGGGFEASAGLRGMRVCIIGQCVTSDQHTGSGTLSYAVGILALVALLGAIVLEKTNDQDWLWRPAGGLCVLWILTLIIWYFNMPGARVLSFGIGMWAGVAGAILVRRWG